MRTLSVRKLPTAHCQLPTSLYLSGQKISMRILVVAATEAEVAPLISELRITDHDLETTPADNCQLLTENCHLLITGVGMVATAFALGRHLATEKYDLALNLGIAGSFDHNIAMGEIVEVNKDTFAELGAEDDADFLPIDKMGFGDAAFYATAKLADHYQHAETSELKSVTAITVNTVHGNDLSIQKIAERLNPQLESMEGAAFFYACKAATVPSLQIRAVSNYVEKRNRDNWQIGLAIKNLNTFAVELLEGLKVVKL